MSELQKPGADQPDPALADNLNLEKLAIFTHPEEVLGDQTLLPAGKRSLLASWASDALGVEDAPSLRQLPSGAVVHVDDIISALKALDLQEPRREASLTSSQPFGRRRTKPSSRWRNTRPEDDDDPPPSAARAGMPVARNVLIACNGGSRTSRWSDIASGSRGSRYR